MSAVRAYALVTLAYWGLTLTDGALRMLVLLHFHELGYTPVELALLFVLYELFGVVTNLFGGYLAARVGLRFTLLGGLALQVVSLALLGALDPGWSRGFSVGYVTGVQALSGVAKDLTKLSAKSTLKGLVPVSDGASLFRWVALLTGSKNALKGAGFFLGGALLSALGYRGALNTLALGLVVLLVCVGIALSRAGASPRSKAKAKFKGLLSMNRSVNVLAAARFFLFGARDVWFVVGLPVFLSSHLGWRSHETGAALALWVIGYGGIQSGAPALISRFTRGNAPQGRAAWVLAALLCAITGGIATALNFGVSPRAVILTGLGLFGVVFAVNSSVHSYLILAYSEGDRVAMNVGFYYMANAGGRLVGTLLSGVMYQLGGIAACLWASAAFAAVAGGLSLFLPRRATHAPLSDLAGDGGRD